MKAVVLAAGEGTRMWPLAATKPKHLLPVAGKPIISYILQALAHNSVRDILMVVGFKGDQIESALGDGTRYGVNIEYLNQPRWTGTASALKVAHAAAGDEPFLAIYGDLWVSSAAIQAVVEKSQESSKVMGVVRVENPSQFGVVTLRRERLVAIREKPSKPRQTEGWVNSGVYVLDEEVFAAVERTSKSKRAEYELTSSLQHLLDEGKEVMGAVIAREDWMDVGRPWDLLEANERILANLPHRVNGTVEQGAVLKGPIWLEESASIKSGSYVEGPVYIGRESRVGPNARIRPSTSIEDNVLVGTSCEVKNSIIMAGTRVPHLSYIGDSIIGENCNLAAGTITANIRLDQRVLSLKVKGQLHSTGRKKLGVIMGDEVQTGINASIMPGVRVGSGSHIGPGTVIFGDVPAGHVVFVKQSLMKKLAKKR
jgi:UDP-N-acetylglucosamine diphosphorylase / glucose-1-phosphate thymidylyltransferase / UDP-N-acetylgalactosamine diphosphorylase / glucosamine-1-phosphate N-acetyltransferase / galactosamine-1-phosphate N-acetyltransferase